MSCFVYKHMQIFSTRVLYNTCVPEVGYSYIMRLTYSVLKMSDRAGAAKAPLSPSDSQKSCSNLMDGDSEKGF